MPPTGLATVQQPLTAVLVNLSLDRLYLRQQLRLSEVFGRTPSLDELYGSEPAQVAVVPQSQARSTDVGFDHSRVLGLHEFT